MRAVKHIVMTSLIRKRKHSSIGTSGCYLTETEKVDK